VRLTFWGLPPPLSVTATDADRLPVAVGLNFTLIKQLAPAATLVPQALVRLKSLASEPVITMLVMLTVTWPLWLNVIVLGRLVLPTGWLPTLRGWLEAHVYIRMCVLAPHT